MNTDKEDFQNAGGYVEHFQMNEQGPVPNAQNMEVLRRMIEELVQPDTMVDLCMKAGVSPEQVIHTLRIMGDADITAEDLRKLKTL